MFIFRSIHKTYTLKRPYSAVYAQLQDIATTKKNFKYGICGEVLQDTPPTFTFSVYKNPLFQASNSSAAYLKVELQEKEGSTLVVTATKSNEMLLFLLAIGALILLGLTLFNPKDGIAYLVGLVGLGAVLYVVDRLSKLVALDAFERELYNPK